MYHAWTPREGPQRGHCIVRRGAFGKTKRTLETDPEPREGVEDRQKIGATVAEPVKEVDRVAVRAARLNDHRRLQVGSGKSGVAIFVAAADPDRAGAART